MAGTHSGSFFWPDFSGSGNKIFQELGFLEINFSYISLAKMTTHIF